MTQNLHLGECAKEPFTIPLSALRKHMISLGASGSGKTVLSKICIEEAVKHGISTLIIDPQGDLASLALPKDILGVPVNIFTPASTKGIPMCINPLQKVDELDSEDAILILDQMAGAVARLIGYDLTSDKGVATKAVLFEVLRSASFTDFSELVSHLETLDAAKKQQLSSLLINKTHYSEIVRKLKLLTIGKNKLLFDTGFKFDIAILMEEPGVDIIYLNTLTSQEEKEFFVASIVRDLYFWMLKNPAKDVQLLFFIDEIAPYLPAGAKKPATKDMLKLLFKQARKYGVSCMCATQNPGDIDYMAFAQFGTWNIGRLTTQQDQRKVLDALRGLTKEDISGQLATLQTGEFFVFSPDTYSTLKRFKTRKLLTQHLTLNENDLEELVSERRSLFVPEEKSEKEQVAKGTTTKKIGTLQKKEKSHSYGSQFAECGQPSEKLVSKHLQGVFKREKILELEESYIPVYQFSVQARSTFLGVTTTKDFCVSIDALDGNLLAKDFSKFYFGADLAQDLTRVLAHAKKKNVLQISYELGDTEKKVRKQLDVLVKARILAVDSHDVYYELRALARNTLASYSYVPDLIPLEKKIAQHKTLAQETVEKALKTYFAVDVLTVSLSYLPVVRVIVGTTKGQRSFVVNKVTGDLYQTTI